MSSLPKRLFTDEEYLAIERKAEYKSEYLNGEIYAMVGASRSHNIIVTNLVYLLESQLRKKACSVYSNDMRVRTRRRGLYAYPDVVVTCGEEMFADDERDILLNPLVIIEVLSDSTASYDRGEKFWNYRQIPSLCDYLLVAQNEIYVAHNSKRSENEWLNREVKDADARIEINSINCYLDVKEVYAKVVFKSEDDDEESRRNA